ncbi:MAG TPA: hypothetical protein VG448_03475 [Solirubrobacterales bacterium]|nr:hypothetical protein [Solirubrobacterales bacterium]
MFLAAATAAQKAASKTEIALAEATKALSKSAKALSETSNGSVSPEVLLAGAIAVIAASVITAIALSRQTTKTLNAEEKRLAMQLSDERERLATQLSHDRAVKERDELRRFADEAAARFDLLTWEVIELDELREKMESEGKKPQESAEFEEAWKTVFRGIREADTLSARLALRLGENHPTAAIYRSGWRLYHECLKSMQAGKPTDPDLFAKGGQAAGDFMRACNELLAADLSWA